MPVSPVGTYILPDVCHFVIFQLRPSSPLLIWEDNQLLRQELEDHDLPNTQDIDVPLGNGFLALVRLHLPKRIDRSGRLKYPMLLNV